MTPTLQTKEEKVFLVIASIMHEGSDIAGVYASKASAEARAAELQEEHDRLQRAFRSAIPQDLSGFSTYASADGYFIQEWSLLP